jgi:hypothetical protein
MVWICICINPFGHQKDGPPAYDNDVWVIHVIGRSKSGKYTRIRSSMITWLIIRRAANEVVSGRC